MKKKKTKLDKNKKRSFGDMLTEIYNDLDKYKYQVSEMRVKYQDLQEEHATCFKNLEKAEIEIVELDEQVEDCIQILEPLTSSRLFKWLFRKQYDQYAEFVERKYKWSDAKISDPVSTITYNTDTNA